MGSILELVDARSHERCFDLGQARNRIQGGHLRHSDGSRQIGRIGIGHDRIANHFLNQHVGGHPTGQSTAVHVNSIGEWIRIVHNGLQHQEEQIVVGSTREDSGLRQAS